MSLFITNYFCLLNFMQTVADEVLLDSHRSRSRSSTSALSSSAIRSPGSVVSPSTTASPISNINSPLDHEGAVIFALQEV